MAARLSRRDFLGVAAGFGLAAGPVMAGRKPGIFASSPPRFDLVIRGGLVIDGLSPQPRKADVGVSGGRIEVLDGLGSATAVKVIEAAGKVVCPGFIDIHSHSGFELLVNPSADSKVRQGVTTELGGNCGGSAFPRRGGTAPDEESILKELGIAADWTDLDGYLAALEKHRSAVNYGTLVGFGSLRSYVLGMDSRRPSAAELDRMKQEAAKAMAQGAFGLSSGLEYAPDRFSRTEEIIEICRAVAERGGFYATHLRSEDAALLEAVGEALHIARSAGLPLHIAHLKASGRDNWYKTPLVLDLLDTARGRGLNVSADRYPYTAYNTGLSFLFPDWALEGGDNKFMERLKDDATRRKMRAEALFKAEANGGWDSLMIQSVKAESNRAFAGRRVQEAAEAEGIEPYDFACGLLLSEGGNVGTIGFGMGEEDTELILRHPLVMVASDGSALAPQGPLGLDAFPHPRNYGTFPRFLGEYVRERKTVTLAEAVRKMTSLPAARMGLERRGVLRKGYFADIVVFDPATVRDEASYLEPKKYPAGIEAVIVNGTIVVESGRHTGALPGRVLTGPGKS